MSSNKKKYSMWFDEHELSEVKEKAEKENRTLANYIRTKLFGGKNK